jgi:hypothetical protein
MTIKTFTTGEVLTAADTNEYLANSGLVYITSTALASSTQTNNVFTSAFQNYRIVVNIDTHSGGASNILAQMSTGGTTYTTAANYYYAGQEQPYTTGAMTTYSNNGAAAYFSLGRLNGNSSGIFICDLFNPQVALSTFYKSPFNDTGYSGMLGGLLNVSNSFDGIRIYHGAGNTVTGTIRFYGVRQA